MIDTGLAGRVAIVTGANVGIGAATASALAAQGVAVIVHYLRLGQPINGPLPTESGEELYYAQRTQNADAVVQAITAAGGKAVAVELDLADPTSAPRLFDAAENAFGPVDILVHNAAHSTPDTFVPEAAAVPSTVSFNQRHVGLSVESIDSHFAVNTRAYALMVAEFARRLVERDGRWGRIIGVSTDSSYCFPKELSYGASKFAQESYSRAAAKELGQFGITVNTVSPGPTQTGWIDAALEASCIANTPLGRVGYPEDIADVIVFLASEQARWVSGQLLYVGGGHRV